MGEAQLLVVPLSGGVGLSEEQASLSEVGYDALGMAVPDDFGRPGAGIQVLLSAEDSFALVTIAAVHNGSAASIALADPDRLVSGGHLPPTVKATTNVFAGGHFEEEATRSGSVAVIAPHGGGIERQTDFQAGILAADTRLQVDTWVCRGRGAHQFRRLHITSDDLSEQSFPGFRALLERTHRLAVSFHGFDVATAPRSNKALDVIVGGQLDLDQRYDVAELIGRTLPPGPAFEVFVATACSDPHAGLSPKNAVNRLSRYGGLQIEQSLRLRQHSEAPRLVAEAVIDALFG
jgi:phage replication-related protein YjqB (UPF0714/DUF867 family)